MKKSLLSALTFFSVLILTGTVIWAQGKPEVRVEDEVDKEEMVLVEEEQEKTDYFLPYPGILPDHPLYSLKLFRDRILDFLIRDPLKRIEFNLLMSDKRLNMGIYLTDKGKAELAEQTVSKGEKYFIKALDELKKAREQGRDLRDLPKKLETALLKHEEVIISLQERSPEDVKEGYNSSLEIIRENQERLREIGEQE